MTDKRQDQTAAGAGVGSRSTGSEVPNSEAAQAGPLDKEAVLASVRKTNRLITVHETWRRGGWGAEIAAVVQEEAFDSLDAPVGRIGARNVPAPFSPLLENEVMPNAAWVVGEVRRLLGKG